MTSPLRVLIVRDARESTKKCSLTPLRGLAGVEFRSWVRERPIALPPCTLLHPDGAALSPLDAELPILLVDSSWHHLPQVLRDLTGEPPRRSIPPGFVTAYPRRSRLYEDPASGLASVEALYVASVLLGIERLDFLHGYRFAPEFLSRNAARLDELRADARAFADPRR
ncbi:MAG: hypothetical protein JNJ88_02705 [Planctomycetes bacterium]|nr:hypothetical protein [Planctomycetota bacterium]